MEEKNKKAIERIDESIASLNKKDFNVYFFVIDTKGTPNGSTQYIYEAARNLLNTGLKVSILHSDEEFVGVSEWLGEEYTSIPHYSIKDNNVKVSASDFLIIPEIFSNVMNQTKELPCKRIVLCQNVNYITEFIPLGVSWFSFGINDVITTSNIQAEDIKALFENAKIKVIEPSIPEYFRNNDFPKKLIVSVLSKDQSIVNRIVKQFHWKYPSLRWVTFTDVRGLSKEQFADTLRESAITVWVDDDTYFGYMAIEAIKSGSILIGKVPDVIPEWMYNEDKTNLGDCGVWFTDMRDVHKLIANVVKSWMNDDVPQELYDSMDNFNKKYNIVDNKQQLVKVFDEYISERINELNVIKDKILNK